MWARPTLHGCYFVLITIIVITGITIALPFLPFSSIFGFVALPLKVMAALIGISALYVIVSELMKHLFFRRYGWK